MAEENGVWPYEKFGDTRLILGRSRIHQLDSAILRGATYVGEKEKREDGLPIGVFRDMLAFDKAVVLDIKARRKQMSTTYYIVLTEMRETANGSFRPKLVLVELDNMGMPKVDVRPCLGNELGGLPVPAAYDAFTAILGALYHQPIDLGAMDLVHDRLEFAGHILDVADYLGVKYAIKPYIESPLKDDEKAVNVQLFYKSVAEDPIGWMQFAYRLRSRMFFKDALAHAVGRMHMKHMQESLVRLDPELRELVKDKAEKLKKDVDGLFLRLQTYYPQEMQRQTNAQYNDPDNIGRNSYSNDIFGWIALTVFRQYINQEIMEAVELGSEEKKLKFVLDISKGGNAYLTREMVEPFHRFFPMTRKGKDVMNDWLWNIKSHVKPWAQSLAVNNSRLMREAGQIGYFTCAELSEDEYPFAEVQRPGSR